MTEPTLEAKQRVCELINRGSDGIWTTEHIVYGTVLHDFAVHVQQASDVAKKALTRQSNGEFQCLGAFAPFILPEPVDPLVEAFEDWSRSTGSSYDQPTRTRVKVMRASLAKHGLKIVESGE